MPIFSWSHSSAIMTSLRVYVTAQFYGIILPQIYTHVYYINGAKYALRNYYSVLGMSSVTFKCPVCSKSFRTESGTTRHAAEKHHLRLHRKRAPSPLLTSATDVMDDGFASFSPVTPLLDESLMDVRCVSTAVASATVPSSSAPAATLATVGGSINPSVSVANNSEANIMGNGRATGYPLGWTPSHLASVVAANRELSASAIVDEICAKHPVAADDRTNLQLAVDNIIASEKYFAVSIRGAQAVCGIVPYMRGHGEQLISALLDSALNRPS